MSKHSALVAVDTINREAFTYYSRLTRVLRFVRSNLASPITLQQAAQVANLDRKYFSRFFRKKVGIPFRLWLLLLRVHRAMVMIEASDESLIRVAYKAGFRSDRTFERSFKSLTTVTPRDYKSCFAPASPNDYRDDLRRHLVTVRRTLDDICRAIGSDGR